jgi:nucleoid-associated protein YgaU
LAPVPKRRVFTRHARFTTTEGPVDLLYRFGGREMGQVSNNGTEELDWQASIAQRQASPITPPAGQAPGLFRCGSFDGSAYANFHQSPQLLNSYNQGSATGQYTVRGGESLRSIAASVYGDGSRPSGLLRLDQVPRT